MQGFLVSAARRINAKLAQRRGTVFPDRYHEQVITSPRQCRSSIAYVLSNFRRHREDRANAWTVDPMSRRPGTSGCRRAPETWPLRVGWVRRGRIDAYAVPGAA
jgi:hypothetical protein